MQADPSAQRALLQIADLDTQVAQLRHRRTTLPEHAQLAELNTQRTRLGEQVVASQTRLEDAEAEQERVEADLNPARARRERNQKMIDAGGVDAKALQSLIAETTHLKGRINSLEDTQLEIMQQIEDETAVRDRLIAQRTEIENRMRALITSRDAAGKELDTRIGELASRRADVAGRLPAELMALYEKVAQRSGTGAAELQARRCGGCRLELDMTELKRHANAAPDQVLRCEECGRILVRTEQSGL
ncbi:MAG: C4-type zinc ribbon domain-containing protein [Brooklawnia sp.]|uniref:zinc ribbon domain-containing protein n=1 Tax=Brooklawnia sp. TaxID=2699740 RepID=UPI003C70D215